MTHNHLQDPKSSEVLKWKGGKELWFRNTMVCSVRIELKGVVSVEEECRHGEVRNMVATFVVIFVKF